ncbi:flavodoxin family protein [Kineothrix sp. MB12-C1]|uniref:flavodoxin family protein n=1 Tax=Kineothrix sp. MB12-C1 TaxID=3070215 RepID=UPI0027D27628|nr:NAD(P)H-dependent oxidoreductase [Kineothrix sp. MB12-C1]WMC92546.1 NAD(P)H-dependent oxidoreductase [Kineothrix sp. MB12-C1]
MKIVMIHGQNHKGSTFHIGRLLAKKLNMESTEFFLPRDMNHFCIGCYSCIEDETKCPFWSEKKIILDAMEQADIFIFTSPNYCLAPSGAMKSFLDLMFDYWMVHRPKEWMFSKRAVVISTSAGASNNSAIKVVKNSLFGWGVPFVKSYGIAVQAMNWGMVKDEKKIKIEKDMTKLAKKLSCDKKPRVGIKTRFMFRMMGMMHSAGWDSSPVEKQYWEEKGWISGKRPW